MKHGFCFDLDGTLTKDEMLPLLAREIGQFEEMQALTAATIKGEIPFRESFLHRCRLLAEIPVSRVRQIVSAIPLHEKMVEFIQAHQDSCYIVTGNLDVWISPLIEKIGCPCYCSTAEVEGDKLLAVRRVLCKGETIQKLKKKHDKIIVIGDGMGDVPMFLEADVAIAYAGVHPPVEALVSLSHHLVDDEARLWALLKRYASKTLNIDSLHKEATKHRI